MAKLIYTAITSLDGYIEDDNGRFDWAEPDAGVHSYVNDLERPVGTHLYGRRMYETMAVWQTVGDEPGLPAAGIFATDVGGIDWADALVAVMDGPDPDSGTAWERGDGGVLGRLPTLASELRQGRTGRVTRDWLTEPER